MLRSKKSKSASACFRSQALWLGKATHLLFGGLIANSFIEAPVSEARFDQCLDGALNASRSHPLTSQTVTHSLTRAKKVGINPGQ